MSLVTQLQNLATRVATEIKAVRTSIGTLANLTTTAKGDIVSAVNEVKADVDAAAQSGGAAINDTGTSTSTVWSSSKTDTEIGSRVSALVDTAPATLDTLNELAAALGDDPNYASTTAAALGKRVRVDAVQAFTAGEQTQARSNIGAQDAAAVGDTATDFVATFEAGL